MSKKSEKSVDFKARLVRSDHSGWHFLVIESSIVDKLKFPGRMRRVLCSINGAERFHCALMPSGDGFFIIVNKKRRDELCIGAEDLVAVSLVQDNSRYGLPMPAEFREVLNQDKAADDLFHSLTPGKQRSILYWVSQVKDIDRRIQTALVFIEHLKENGGKIIHHKLQAELKRPSF